MNKTPLTYRSFKQLVLNETEGIDYRVRTRAGFSGIAIMAIHGGGIEPGTTEIAEAVAGQSHTFYTFSGLKDKGNASLHITSSRFDEPTGLEIAKTAWITVSFHGCSHRGLSVFLGRKNSTLKSIICKSLEKAGFKIAESAKFPGTNPLNICNRCRCGTGVQLEISAGLRSIMFNQLNCSRQRKPTGIFTRFVDAFQSAIDDFNA